MESLVLTSLGCGVRASECGRGQLLAELHAQKWARKMRKNAGSPNQDVIEVLTSGLEARVAIAAARFAEFRRAMECITAVSVGSAGKRRNGGKTSSAGRIQIR